MPPHQAIQVSRKAMKRKPGTNATQNDPPAANAAPKGLVGSQTLLRGLDVLEAVAAGATTLSALTDLLELNRSTAHRLAASLVERRYLRFSPRIGYALGPKSLEIGFQASAQMSLPRIAREYIEALAASTGDTIHLGILDGTRALYVDKIAGHRRVEISSRIGERQPLHSTGLGKALLLDETEERLRQFYHAEHSGRQRHEESLGAWLRRMREYAKLGCAFDLEENEDCIRCVAAPVRDATGRIKAAVSVSSAAQYMDDKRMRDLAEEVRLTAQLISRDLGWNGPAPSGKTPASRAGSEPVSVS
jgi:DNA-binding IclR family transcriptional regulator